MNSFTGTSRLLRLNLRRDRIQLSAWVYGFLAFALGGGKTISDNYSTVAERANTAKAIADNPALLILRAPPTGTSPGALGTAELSLSLTVLIALMSIFTVTRHTRQNEETGRAELIGSAAVGRYALLTAGIGVTVVANIACGIGVLIGQLVNGLPVTGSIAFAASISGLGLAFAGITAVAAQLPQSARGTNGLAATVMVICYLICGIGNIAGRTSADHTSLTPAWPAWFSPFGWAQQMRAFTGNQWWVLALLLALFAGCVYVASAVVEHRDVGMGLVPARRGPARAPATLLSPLGLAWRLHRGALLGWVVAMAVCGVLFGSLTGAVQDALGDNEQATKTLKEIGGGSSASLDTYFAATLAMVGAAVAAYAVSALLRLRSEETGPLETVLSTSVNRYRWLLSHCVCAVLGAAALLAVHGAVTGLTYGITDGSIGHRTGRMTLAALAQLPAILVVVGIAVAMFGVLPRRMIPISWTALTLSIVLGQLGRLLNLPQEALDVSPFTHLTGIPGPDVPVAAITVLSLVAAILLGLGAVNFRRRDLAA